MRTFRNPFLNWLIEHPVLAGFTSSSAPGDGGRRRRPLLAPIRKVPLIYNLRNLQIRWKTTLVTALAFTLVTGLLTFMLSFVKGMDRLIETAAIPATS